MVSPSEAMVKLPLNLIISVEVKQSFSVVVLKLMLVMRFPNVAYKQNFSFEVCGSVFTWLPTIGRVESS